MRALLAVASAATAVVGSFTVASAGSVSHRADIGPVPVPTQACVQYTDTRTGIIHYLCLNYPQLPSL